MDRCDLDLVRPLDAILVHIVSLHGSCCMANGRFLSLLLRLLLLLDSFQRLDRLS